jgi:hypothetical protein
MDADMTDPFNFVKAAREHNAENLLVKNLLVIEDASSCGRVDLTRLPKSMSTPAAA